MGLIRLRNYFSKHKILPQISSSIYVSHSSIGIQNLAPMNSDALSYLEMLNKHSRMIIVMSGIPGCGKSTFSHKITDLVDPNGIGWVVLNQDTLQTRKRVESEAHRLLEAGYSVVIDRCNFDIPQRRHWVELAYQYNVDAILCIVLPHSQDVPLCAARARQRGDDGVHSADTNWNAVCNTMRNQFRFPVLEEGFSGIFHCRSEEDMDTVLNAIVTATRRDH